MKRLMLLGIFISSTVIANSFNYSDLVRRQVAIVDQAGQVRGSGAVIKVPSGRIMFLTNAHVCERVAMAVQIMGLHSDLYVGSIIKISRITDLCLVQANTPQDTKDVIIEPHAVQTGDMLVMFGHPMGLKVPQPSAGQFIDYGTLEDWGLSPAVVGLTTIPVFPGNSGSPVFDTKGHMVGLMCMSWLETSYQGMFIPGSVLLAFIKGN